MINLVKGRFGNGGGNGSGAASEPTYRLTIDLEGATPDQPSTMSGMTPASLP